MRASRQAIPVSVARDHERVQDVQRAEPRGARPGEQGLQENEDGQGEQEEDARPADTCDQARDEDERRDDEQDVAEHDVRVEEVLEAVVG